MIEVRNLSKSYGSKTALDNISFTAADSEILGFLGPNGAGKSTTMNIISGYLSASSGSVLIDGIDVLDDPISAKRNLGYLPEQPPLYADMTVDEYLRFVYSLKKCRFPKRSHLEEISVLTGIENVRSRVIRNLSKGYRQRVGLAQALIGNPKVIILDEPTVGLDPKQIIEIRSLIKKLGESHTMILSSHILTEVQAVCDKIVVINEGKIVADDTTGNLSKTLSCDSRLILHIDGAQTEVKALLEQITDIEQVTVLREIEKSVWEYEVYPKIGKDIRRELFKRLAERRFPILMMRGSEMSLEEIFLRLTAGGYYENEFGEEHQ